MSSLYRARQWMVSSQIKLQITRYWIILCHDKFDQDPSFIKCVANCSLIDKNGVNARCEQFMSNYRQFGVKWTESAIILAIKRSFCKHLSANWRLFWNCLVSKWHMWRLLREYSAKNQRKSHQTFQIVPELRVRQFFFFFFWHSLISSNNRTYGITHIRCKCGVNDGSLPSCAILTHLEFAQL